MPSLSDPSFILYAVLNLVVFIISLTVHEYAHARVAYALGDDTAAYQGRMTLNPLPHIDPIGTLLLPVLGMSGIPVIGWAKPVPVNPVRLTRRLPMRTGFALVAAAGPLSNLVLAILALGLFKLLVVVGPFAESSLRAPVADLLLRMFGANIGLCVFNLLPIPPLDGSRLLPRSFDPILDHVRRYSFIVLIAVVWFAGSIIWVPVRLLADALSWIFGLPPLFG